MIKKLGSAFKKAMFPENVKCMMCNRELQTPSVYEICPRCLEKLVFNNLSTCHRCGKHTWAGATYCNVCKKHLHFFNKARAPLLYGGSLAYYIQQFKYANYEYLDKPLAKFIFNEYLLSSFEVDLVLPVPMYYRRTYIRGYNHSELLAREFCKMAHLPLDTKNFVRIIDTEQQSRMNKQEREENLKGAFRVLDTNVVKGKKILLIDDIITTGSTIDECAKVLYECGAKEVNALAIAHTPNKMYLIKQISSLKGTKTFDKMSKIMYNTQMKTNRNKSLPYFSKTNNKDIK